MTFTQFLYTVGAIGLALAFGLVLASVERRAQVWREADRRARLTDRGFSQLGDLGACVAITAHHPAPYTYRLAVRGRVFGFHAYADLHGFVGRHLIRMSDPLTGAEYLRHYKPNPLERVIDLSHPSVR